MPRDRVSRLLDEFSAVTNAAPRPESPARRMIMRNRFPVATLTGATLVIVVVAVAAFAIGRAGPIADVGASPSASSPTSAMASPLPSVPASPAPSVSASSTPTARPSAPAVPTATPTVGPCRAASLAARITLWEGAAGSRIAHVELKNTGTTSCRLETLDRPQLVAGDGSVRIDGTNPATTDRLTVAPGELLTTLVSVSNDCKPSPVPPISVAFVFGDGQRLVAKPVSPTDTETPPCNGAGSPAMIDMHPWAR
jgi:hypothetical protein